jgi:hypothetical protein
MYTKADGSIERDYLMLTREDYRVVGSSFRDLEGAFSSDFRYRNFDLSFMFSFGIGGKFYDGIYASLMTSTRGQSYHKDILKAWRKPGDITDVPKAEYDVLNQSPLSDRFLVSNSFLNLKNINVGYTLPAKTLSNLKLTSLRIYIAADNIYYLSARKGLDVQQAFFGSSSFNYFPYRTLMFGLNLGL